MLSTKTESIINLSKAFLILKHSLLIYGKMIDLYSIENSVDVLRLRYEGKTVEESLEILEISRTTYFGYLSKPREQADSRIKEILELYGLETE